MKQSKIVDSDAPENDNEYAGFDDQIEVQQEAFACTKSLLISSDPATV